MVDIDLKERCLRVAKKINHDLQRSNMNPILKPYFTESSVQYINNDNIEGITLNVKCINCEDVFNNIQAERFKNNFSLLESKIARALKRENLTDKVKIVEYSPIKNESFMYNDLLRDKYINIVLVPINENSASRFAADDLTRRSRINPDRFDGLKDFKTYGDNSYSLKDSMAEGPMTRHDLVSELNPENNTARGTMVANAYSNSLSKNIYATISDINDYSNLAASDERIIRRDANLTLHDSNKVDVDTTDSKLSEDTHFFTLGRRIERVDETYCNNMYKFLTKCKEDFFNAMIKTGYDRENDVTEEELTEQIESDYDAVQKGKKVSFDYFFYYVYDSSDQVAVNGAYVTASNLVNQFNIKAHDTKLNIKFKLFYKENQYENKRTRKSMKNLKSFRPSSNLHLFREDSTYEQTSKLKYKTYTLYVVTDSPIFKITI